MPYPRLIPCLDVADGSVVKGVRFRALRRIGDPVELAERYSGQGADELVFLDIKATVDERAALLDVVAQVAEAVSVPFTVGGGVRSVDDAAALFDAGADKVALNSAAVEDVRLVSKLAKRYGEQAVVVAVDAREGEVTTHAGARRSGLDAVEWARTVQEHGAGEILLTSIDADGTRSGYDMELTSAVVDAVGVPVIASGGAGSAADVAHVLSVAQAAVVASIVHERPDGMTALREAVTCLGVGLREMTC